MKKLFKILLSLLVLLGMVSALYFGNYYHSNESVNELIQNSENVVKEKDYLAFIPEKYDTAIIFYPGAKVEYDAYSKLMLKLSKEGILCVEVKMPLNFAIIGKNKIEDIMQNFPEVKHFYIAGHSLGGASAAMWLENNSKLVDGLILLASYSSVDLSNTDLKVLSIYGDQDGVLKLDTYNRNKQNLPNLKEVVIKGGNHAGFAEYGKQKGDGDLLIDSNEQIELTKEAILSFLS